VYRERALPADTELWIYTDNADWFKGFDIPLPLHYRSLDPATLKAWRGSIDFVHRVKIELLRDFTAAHQGNILYVDTDVVFTAPIDAMLQAIGGGALYMHVPEGIVSVGHNPVLRKLHKHLKQHNHDTINGVRLYDLPMWNAGVLGLSTSYTPVLEKVLAFTDREYPLFPKHIVEQFAFSVYFAEAGNIHPASPYILHYWNLKEARLVLSSFFKRYKALSWQALVDKFHVLQLPVLMQEKAGYYQNRSVIAKLLKKQWKPGEPEWG